MPLRSLQDWWSSIAPWPAPRAGLPPAFRRRVSGQVLADARLDFADALLDMRSPVAVQTVDRIATARSMYELWNFREQIFSLVARNHDQSEANRRIASLDRHFGPAAKRTTFAPPPSH